MTINWEKYELVLVEDSDKECEVTGNNLGSAKTFICPVSDLEVGKSPNWIPQGNYSSYGGYQSIRITFQKLDNEGAHFELYLGYKNEIVLTPFEPKNKWESGSYGFGSYRYFVTLTLKEKEK